MQRSAPECESACGRRAQQRTTRSTGSRGNAAARASPILSSEQRSSKKRQRLGAGSGAREATLRRGHRLWPECTPFRHACRGVPFVEPSKGECSGVSEPCSRRRRFHLFEQPSAHRSTSRVWLCAVRVMMRGACSRQACSCVRWPYSPLRVQNPEPIDAAVVRSAPYTADSPITNDVRGRVALILRGNVPFVDKARRAMHAGAIERLLLFCVCVGASIRPCLWTCIARH